MTQFRKLMAIVCVFCLLLSCLAGCSAPTEESAPAETAAATESSPAAAQTGATNSSGNSGFGQVDPPRAPSSRNSGLITNLSLDQQGHLQIVREPAKSEPMGDPGTWTIFVYLCGSDLESDDGLASGDLQEMIDGSADSQARYVVMTGGSLEWHNEVVDNTTLGLFLIEDGGITQLDSLEYNYMNDPETLRAFLSWGVASYPAEKMALVIWDHGGGSVGGVCVDEYFRDNLASGVLEDMSGYHYTLTLSDISGVLSQVFEDMTDQFEFIGYDACLMGTLENAFMLSPYARYMYASEESEPGYGWDYAAIGKAIGSSGKITGDRLGKVVCDSFYQSCADVKQESNSTLSCIDLSRIDDLVMAFDAFAVNMMSAAEDPAALATIVKKMNHVEFYGGNSDSEGHFNLVDLAGLANGLSSVISGSDVVLNAIEQAVLYYKNGALHKRSCGLSVYYPLYVNVGSADLGEFAKVACSPYYYGYVAQTAYAAANGGLQGYDSTVSLTAWATAADADVENVIEDYGEAQVTGKSPYVVFAEEPHLSEDGIYQFTLKKDSLPYINRVEADIYFLSEDEQDLVFLGSTTDINDDWDTGVFQDNFDGLWFCLPDGQMISTAVISDTDSFAEYTTPVLLNGEETNLRFVLNYSDYSVKLTGIWSGEEIGGFAGRNVDKLKAGDIIQPIFIATDMDTEEQSIYYGEEYTYDGSDDLYFNTLFDARYYYQFCIYDIYGDNYTTEGVFFQVDNGEIFFELEE